VPGNNFSKFISSLAKEAAKVVQSGQQPANAYELNVGQNEAQMGGGTGSA